MPYSWRCSLPTKASLVLLIIAIIVGDFGSFYQASLTWKVPFKPDEDCLCLLLLADPQIQGYAGELPFVLGSITRWDSDRYLRNAFSMALNHVKPDVVVVLGDLFDEGLTATDREFLQYKSRFDKIFSVADDVYKVYLAGDNDIGGEGYDILTQRVVARFTKYFGPINEIINIKSFQLVKVNTVSFIRYTVYEREKSTFNDTVTFINNLPLYLRYDAKKIVLAHAPLPNLPSKLYNKFLISVKPKVAVAGHLHKHIEIYHRLPNPKVIFREYVIPTCSYRMGTTNMGIGVVVIDSDGKSQISILKLPERYYYLWIYLALSCLTVVSFLLSSRGIRTRLVTVLHIAICLPRNLWYKIKDKGLKKI